MHMKRVSIIIVGVLAVAAALAIASVSFAGSSNPHATRVPPPPQAASTISPVFVKHLAVFRRARASADTAAAQHIDLTPYDIQQGANPALARLAMTTPDGDQISLLPTSSGGLCFYSSRIIEGACVSSADPSRIDGPHDSIICGTGLPVNEVEVYGLMADGDSNETATLADGSRVPLTVQNNVFVLRTPRIASALPQTIEWDNASGHHSVGASVPSDAPSTPCATAANYQALAKTVRGIAKTASHR